MWHGRGAKWQSGGPVEERPGGLHCGGPMGLWPGRLVCGWLVGLWGRGLEGSSLAVLSVNCGVEKPSTTLGIQGAEVSTLPCALPQPSMSPGSHQGP
jgi:hypothetical protein